jgi:Gas vesicle synthesis protein GvpO
VATEARPGAKRSASRIAAQAQEHISALTSHSVVGVTSVEPAEQGWLVHVDVVENRRIPPSSDMPRSFPGLGAHPLGAIKK